MADIKRGVPSVQPGSEQLPQGEASNLNDAMAVASRLAAGGFHGPAKTLLAGESTQAGGVQPQTAVGGGIGQAAGPPVSRVQSPPGPHDQFLFGDVGPGQAPVPRVVTGRRPPVPESVKAYLPLLAKAANAPGAPIALQLLYRAIVTMAREDES